MTKHSVVLIPGDGIGVETSAAMQRVVAASGVDIEWVEARAGAGCIDEDGTPLPEATVEAIREHKTAIKGPVTTPVGTGFRSVNVALRKTLDLYVNLRPVMSIPGAGGRYDDVDLVIVRENTEDLYAGIEFEAGAPDTEELIGFIEEHKKGTISADSGISIKPISVRATRNIVEYAFDYVARNGRRRVTAVHKANIMKHSDGLFLRVAREVAEERGAVGADAVRADAARAGAGVASGTDAAGADAGAAAIAFDDRIVDAFCMNMVMDPSQFDVIVFPNLYGDIASDLAAGLVGGLGLAPGANIGKECAVFEAVHGSAPDIAGKDLANPTAQILSAAMMLDHLDEREAAGRIRRAVRSVYAKGEHLTADIRRAEGAGSPASCTEFTDALVRELS